MRWPISFGATPTRHTFRDLRYVRDIDAYDGFVLSAVYRARDGSLLVIFWCDCDRDEGVQRWLLAPTTGARLAMYLAGALSHHSLLVGDGGIAKLIDTHGDNVRQAWRINRRHLPADYLPANRWVGFDEEGERG